MRKPAFLTAVLLLAGVIAVPALADQPGADWISVDQAKSKLMAAVYSSVSTIEADDGHWEGEGMKERPEARIPCRSASRCHHQG